jgi:hypothetical protein
MLDKQEKIKLQKIENKLGKRYSLFLKLFFLITIIFAIFIIIVFYGINSLGYGYNWAGISLQGWLISICALYGILLIFELIFYFHFSTAHKKRIDFEKPKIEYINGKRVYVYTFPEGKEGGIFSKTYIELDKNSVLRLRSCIIPPEELWI